MRHRRHRRRERPFTLQPSVFDCVSERHQRKEKTQKEKTNFIPYIYIHRLGNDRQSATQNWHGKTPPIVTVPHFRIVSHECRMRTLLSLRSIHLRSPSSSSFHTALNPLTQSGFGW